MGIALKLAVGLAILLLAPSLPALTNTVYIDVAQVRNLRIGNPVQSAFYVNSQTGNDANMGTALYPWLTLAKVNGYSFPAGAIVDGMNTVFTERLVVPTNSITIRNLTVDGLRPFSNVWAQVSGEIYSNGVVKTPMQMFEDGIKLTPLVCTNETDAVDNLARGNWTHDVTNRVLYYRASNGAAPATHTLRITSREWDSSQAMILVNGRNTVTLTNCHVQNFGQRASRAYSLWVTNSSGIQLLSCSVSNCAMGPAFEASVNISTDTNFCSVSNVQNGFRLGGNGAALGLTNCFLQGTNFGNGSQKLYTGLWEAYYGDGDGGGAGGLGATNFYALTLGNCYFISNGPPVSLDEGSQIGGSGFYVGTTQPLFINDLTITNCYFKDNYAYGLFVTTNVARLTIKNCIFQRNGNSFESGMHNCYIRYGTNATNPEWNAVSFTFEKNLIADVQGTNGQAGLRLYLEQPTGSISIQSNAFWNCGGAVNYDADFKIAGPSAAALTEDYNVFYRVAPAGTTKVAQNGSDVYDINHIVGGSAGFWQFDTGWGANDTVDTAGPLVNPASLTYVP